MTRKVRWSVRGAALLAGASVIALLAGGAAVAQEVVMVGETAQGTLVETDSQLSSGEKVDTFLFRGQANQQVTIRMTSDAFDPYLMINGPADFSQQNDDAEDGDKNALLSVRLPVAGTYRISATSFEPGERGAYALALIEGDAAPGVDTPQGGGAIAIGQTLRGQLTSDDPVLADESRYDEWVLTGAPGASYVARLSSNAFDPYMRVTGDGLDVGNDDDPTARGALNSRVDFVMPASGQVTIQANSFNGGETGAYSLSVAEAEAPRQTQVVDASPISIGQTVNGALSEGSGQLGTGEYYAAYTLSGQAGQTVELAMTAPGFDTYVSIYGRDGAFLEFNDDDLTGDGGSNSRLVTILPADGDYLITATSFAVGETGDFTLSARTATPVQEPVQPVVNTSLLNLAGQDLDIRGDLADGDDQINQAFADTYEFDGQAGQMLDIALSSDAFDTYLILRSPSGREERNDDHDGTDSLISTSLTETGRYQLIATSFGSGSTGGYQLTSAMSEAVPPPPSVTRTAAILGDGDELDLDGFQTDLFTFPGQAGETLGVSALSNDFDTTMTLVSPSGEVIENDDGPDGSTNSRIDTVLTETGDYALMVSGYEPGDGGAYEVVFGDVQDTVIAGDVQGGPRVFAVMVGISEYGGEASDLAYTAQDATKLSETLRRQGVLNPASITLTDAGATADSVREAFRTVAAQAGPDDIFMFFYSGHGGQDDSTVSPTEPDGMTETLFLRGGAITDTEMAEMFATLNTRMSLLILDSCFSGGFARNVINRPGVMGLFSSEEDLTSAVPDKFEAGGYMSAYVQEAFTGQGDENADGLLTAGELSSYVRERFRGDGKVESVTSDQMSRNYQYFVVDRGGVQVDDVVLRMAAL